MTVNLNSDDVVRATAILMAGTASLALRWAGNAFLALVAVLTVAEIVTGADLFDLGFALSPTALWIASWIANKSRDRIADQVVRVTRSRR